MERADSVLKSRPSRDVRAAALLIAGDATFALRSYKDALLRYAEFLSVKNGGPDAAHAVLQLGWAGLRDGQRQAAQRSWIEVADRFPTDPRAPLALLLAGELANQAGDMATANALLDRLIADYPSSAYAAPARLSRSILALRGNQEDVAVRSLEHVIHSQGIAAIDTRRRIRETLAVPSGGETSLEASAMSRASNVATARDESLDRFAAAFVDKGGDRDSNVYVLHGLTLLGAADRGWSDTVVATLVQRLVEGWPTYPPAPALLTRVGAAAASNGQWPIARRAYETLIARYPASPMAASARVDLAEALFRTGARTEARGYLGQAIAAGGENGPRALLLLAEAEESAGNHREAQAAYDRVLREHPRAKGTLATLMSRARQLESSGRVDDARVLFQRIVAVSDGEVAAEASYRIGSILSAQKQYAAAVEWFITAAYVAPTQWQRPSLLGAVRCFTQLDRTHEALIAYRKLMAAPVKAGPRETGPAVSASPALVLVRDDRDGIGEAALRLGEALQRAGNNEAAVEMYLSAARLVNGPTTSNALVGAVRSFVAAGDHASAEAMYRRLLESGDADSAVLAEARKAIQTQ